MKRFAIICGLLVAVSAGTGLDSARAQSPAPKPQRACFNVRSVNSFNAQDDRTVYVRVGVRDVYKLTMFGNCFDMAWANAIGLVSRPSAFICTGDTVDVDVVTRGTAFGRNRCPVSSIQKLTAEEAAALPKKARP